MAILRQIIPFIEQIAPPLYQENYDNCGLLTGDPDQEIDKALVSLDCTEAVVDEAIEQGCKLIIAHHPILFKGLKSITGRNYVERTLLKAIREHIAIYAAHTSLDNVIPGVNELIAQKLGLVQIRTLQPKSQVMRQLYTYVPEKDANQLMDALFRAGAGSIGDYRECSFSVKGEGTYYPMESANPHIGIRGTRFTGSEQKVEVVYPIHLENNVLQILKACHPYEEIAYGCLDIQVKHPKIGAGVWGLLPEAISEFQFLQKLKEDFGCSCIRHTNLSGRMVKQVALCGGSGSFLLSEAIRQQADVYVTSDIKYHEFFDADGHILLADIGHYESEQYTPEIIIEHLSGKIPNFALLNSSVHTNPVNYFS